MADLCFNTEKDTFINDIFQSQTSTKIEQELRSFVQIANKYRAKFYAKSRFFLAYFKTFLSKFMDINVFYVSLLLISTGCFKKTHE